MKSTSSVATIAILASVFAVGCVGEPNETEPAGSGDDVAEAEQALDVDGASPDGVADEAKPDRKRHDREHWRGKRGKMGRGRHGPMGAFIGALRQLDLSDAQQAELKELKASMRDGKKGSAHGELDAAISSAVASGNVSVAALSAELDAVEDGAAERVAAMQKALNTVHATLTPAQRTELVSIINERFEAKADGKRGRKGKRDRAGKRGKRGDKMIGRLARKLDLTEEQIAHAKSYEAPEHAKPDREAMRAKMKTVLDAFATDGFDATALGIGAEMPAMARAKAEHMIGGLEHLVPVLDDTQRTELSKMIQERGKRGKFGRKGRRGKRGRFGKRDRDGGDRQGGERFDGRRRGLRAPR
jgi:Spy/CpxP family protein refolding chaperone